MSCYPNSDAVFSKILREPLKGKMKLTHGRCRYSTSSSKRRGEVHVDTGCAWSSVIFHTLDQHCHGGTEFFRHKRYGIDRVPLSVKEAKLKYSMKSVDEVFEKVIKKEGKDRNRWDCIQTLSMKFNRAIFSSLAMAFGWRRLR